MRRRNIGEDAEVKELLGGLCPCCYRSSEECKCAKPAISAVNRSGGCVRRV